MLHPTRTSPLNTHESVDCFQVKDQQEAERKKVTSQEIQVALEVQTKVITEKQADVKMDLAKVEPAVIEAQQGRAGHSLCRHTDKYGRLSCTLVGRWKCGLLREFWYSVIMMT